MLSIEDLPKDDSGLIPAGMWHVALRDNLTDGFAGMAFQDGVTIRPIDGRSVVRLAANMGIVGAIRVEGEPCELGATHRIFAAHRAVVPGLLSAIATDVADQCRAGADKIRAAGELAEKMLMAQPAPVEVSPAPTATAPEPQEAPQALPPTPTSLAELDALTEAEARALAAEMGSTDKRWSVQKVRRFIADELGL
jgi:hypothetical protein